MMRILFRENLCFRDKKTNQKDSEINPIAIGSE